MIREGLCPRGASDCLIKGGTQHCQSAELTLLVEEAAEPVLWDNREIPRPRSERRAPAEGTVPAEAQSTRGLLSEGHSP